MVSGETFIIIIIIIIIFIIIIIIISFITVFACVLFAHQPGANHAPSASVTPVNHSVHTLSIIFIIIIKKKTPVLNTSTIDVSQEAPKGDGPFQSTLSQPME